ncbi:hypothetical protein [Natronobiforma cellulositropha]|uniref:hypothetical protein n=1 Tax=Natronobiforma cellulositropha TaxID=1679076 RepID=UPI0021D611E2|nr:hypothetical protein [Natronobiforma cellulositropha]
MPACNLCRRQIEPRTDLRRCECGLVMHERCAEKHRRLCPVHGEDRWVAALER